MFRRHCQWYNCADDSSEAEGWRIDTEAGQLDLISRLDQNRLAIYLAESGRQQKRLSVAYTLLLTLGGLGTHRLYLGDHKGALYTAAAAGAVTLLKSGLRAEPGQRGFMVAGTCLVWLILCGLVTDLFTLPAQVDRANRRIRRELLNRMTECD